METAGIPDLAGKLQRLFNSIPRTDGQGWYTNEAMARELAERGVPVTVQHLSSLRTGQIDAEGALQLIAALKQIESLEGVDDESD